MSDCNNLIGHDRLIYEEILIKSLGSPADLNKLVPSVESAYVLFRPGFVSASLVYFSEIPLRVRRGSRDFRRVYPIV